MNCVQLQQSSLNSFFGGLKSAAVSERERGRRGATSCRSAAAARLFNNQMAQRKYDHSLKLVLLGDSGVGKSCLMKQFVVSGRLFSLFVVRCSLFSPSGPRDLLLSPKDSTNLPYSSLHLVLSSL